MAVVVVLERPSRCEGEICRWRRSNWRVDGWIRRWQSLDVPQRSVHRPRDHGPLGRFSSEERHRQENVMMLKREKKPSSSIMKRYMKRATVKDELLILLVRNRALATSAVSLDKEVQEREGVSIKQQAMISSHGKEGLPRSTPRSGDICQL